MSTEDKPKKLTPKQEAERIRVWEECIALARRALDGANKRLMVAELAIKCCDIIHGGGGHWSGHKDVYTVKQFATELNIHHKTLWMWIGVKRSIIDKLAKGEYQESDWKYAARVYRKLKANPSIKEIRDKFREEKIGGNTNGKLEIIINWADSHLKFLRKTGSKNLDQIRLYELLEISEMTTATLKSFLKEKTAVRPSLRRSSKNN